MKKDKYKYNGGEELVLLRDAVVILVNLLRPHYDKESIDIILSRLEEIDAKKYKVKAYEKYFNEEVVEDKEEMPWEK